jgi:spore coat polysaccharide biosynthesis predicted glycosyltransferase SpsG
LAGGVKAPPIIIRCDGGASLGMGHVSRCLALADELRDAHACDVVFAMRDPDSASVAAVRSRAYSVTPVVDRQDADYGPSLLALTSSHSARAVVVDVRDALSRASLDAIRASGVRVVTIDDGSERRLASDLAFYPPVPQVEELDWTGFAGRRFAGWDWVLLEREFAHDVAGAFQASDLGSAERLALQTSPPIDLLVTMGGSDPAGMTEFALEALNLLPRPLAVQVVVGPAFGRAPALAASVARSKHAVRVSQGPDAMAPLMRASRMAVASFGLSAYELAACGVPVVHLCLTADHARSSSAFDREQIAQTLGVFPAVQSAQLADAVAGLLGDPRRMAEMAARARTLIDGRGAKRVAALVVAELS